MIEERQAPVYGWRAMSFDSDAPLLRGMYGQLWEGKTLTAECASSVYMTSSPAVQQFQKYWLGFGRWRTIKSTVKVPEWGKTIEGESAQDRCARHLSEQAGCSCGIYMTHNLDQCYRAHALAWCSAHGTVVDGEWGAKASVVTIEKIHLVKAHFPVAKWVDWESFAAAVSSQYDLPVQVVNDINEIKFKSIFISSSLLLANNQEEIR